MLHEIIMCLLGNVGGLFQYKFENNIKKIKVSIKSYMLDKFDPSQVDLMQAEGV